jgi:hypothetical protein
MHGTFNNGCGYGSQVTAIRAELRGSDTAEALGIVVHSSTPVIVLCRKLIAAGHDPALPLVAYRGETLCLYVRSIGAAARLEPSSNSYGFIARDRLRRRPPVGSGGRGARGTPGDDGAAS